MSLEEDDVPNDMKERIYTTSLQHIDHLRHVSPYS